MSLLFTITGIVICRIVLQVNIILPGGAGSDARRIRTGSGFVHAGGTRASRGDRCTMDTYFSF